MVNMKGKIPLSMSHDDVDAAPAAENLELSSLEVVLHVHCMYILSQPQIPEYWGAQVSGSWLTPHACWYKYGGEGREVAGGLGCVVLPERQSVAESDTHVSANPISFTRWTIGVSTGSSPCNSPTEKPPTSWPSDSCHSSGTQTGKSEEFRSSSFERQSLIEDTWMSE